MRYHKKIGPGRVSPTTSLFKKTSFIYLNTLTFKAWTLQSTDHPLSLPLPSQYISYLTHFFYPPPPPVILANIISGSYRHLIYICLSFHQGVCLSIYLCINLSVSPSVCLSVHLSVYKAVSESISLEVHLTVCLDASVLIFLCAQLSVRSSVCVLICLCVQLSVRSSVCVLICLCVLSICLCLQSICHVSIRLWKETRSVLIFFAAITIII